MNKLKVSFMVAAMLLLSGVSSCASDARQPVDHASNQQVKQTETGSSNDAYASIPSDEIQHGQTEVEFLWDAKDPYYGYNNLPVAARVHIDSIDGGRTFSPITNQYVIAQTIGKMTVREVYKGDVKPGDQLNYSRGGGIVTFDEYWSSLNQQQKDKAVSQNNGRRPTPEKKYVEKKFIDDIDIEVGKEYVVFLLPQSSKDGKLHEYLMDGFQFGLREVKGSGAETTVLNNETKEWESLGSVVKLP
ncbi:hypothetical protein QFZ30_003936 [Arthrobacter pascens]|uniref:hypothetical protein n=1 Tax=Arthrobacter pascens TaxID=1677 RepID=UPI002794D7A7|nr:hypothetical protein [Arthrobacter pascens]MDQ0680554.1 hypothetical protein [Arthrobacter pascens]